MLIGFLQEAVTIEDKQIGVGGDNCWEPNALALPAYRLEDNTYQYSFFIEFKE